MSVEKVKGPDENYEQMNTSSKYDLALTSLLKKFFEFFVFFKKQKATI